MHLDRPTDGQTDVKETIKLKQKTAMAAPAFSKLHAEHEEGPQLAKEDEAILKKGRRLSDCWSSEKEMVRVHVEKEN